MSLSNVNTNFSLASYQADRNFEIEGNENIRLRDGLIGADLMLTTMVSV